MGQSLVQNYAHIVFSTKNRKRWLSEKYQNRIYKYLMTICKDLNCVPIRINGHDDHVHILCSLSKNITIVDFLQRIKGNSSRFIKTLDSTLGDFAWQSGYAYFSVSHDHVPILIKYIENQQSHHSKTSMEEELENLLIECGLEYDPKYLWSE